LLADLTTLLRIHRTLSSFCNRRLCGPQAVADVDSDSFFLRRVSIGRKKERLRWVRDDPKS
jgi:hypothetical protein